jgi:formate dehydrogenase
MVRMSAIGDRFDDVGAGWSLAKLQVHGPVRLGEGVPVGVSGSKVLHPDGLVRLAPAPVIDRLAALATTSLPEGLVLIGRRDDRTMNSWLHNLRPVRGQDPPRLHVNPEDAARIGIQTGDVARVESGVGGIEVPVEVTDAVIPGVVSYPHGWGHAGGWRTANAHGGVNVNVLAPNTVESKDPLSGASWLDGFPVSVRAAADPATPVDVRK